jgi:hypothetical protein
MTKESYFWNLKGENFAGRAFGSDVTDIFGDDKARIKKYLDLGQVVTSKPIDFDHAKENELGSLRAEVKKLLLRNSELESEIKKSSSVKLKEAKEKIKDLETQLEELTKPRGK